MTDVNAINSTQTAPQVGAAPAQQPQKEQTLPPPPPAKDSVEISQDARNASGSSAPQPASSAQETFDALS